MNATDEAPSDELVEAGGSAGSLDVRVRRPSAEAPSWVRGGRGRWALPAVLAVLAVALFVVNRGHDVDADAGPQARKVLAGHVEQLLTYDYRRLDDELATESTWLGGSFADQYQALVNDKIGPAATRAKVVTEARISASGVVSSSSDEVKILFFVNVTTRSSELDQPRTQGSRLVVTGQKVDGDWLITALDPV
ncbi:MULTISPECIES: hypothetical protein [unclassified Nocardioides]|uniref:hypothetical protein n=1 Tax=unclassified Nocardioides TaxID=2615069 RepID=UPI000713594B|nr:MULTISPECIES: hypothetical protein [unclassified Nocardioides]KRC59757.1 hypothetical protein ASE19_01690 [Nocardioides sp. Root79]KRC68416.1 hypothetical protein ASE20_16270 [Nocardioides sp. Root240]